MFFRGPGLVTRVLFAFLLSLGVLFPVSARANFLEWALVNWKVRHDFPRVPRLSTEELAAWQADKRRPQPLLLDVRTAEEFAVSHLRGARQVSPEARPATLDLPKDRPIVTYCSVGYRSAALAERLLEAGYRDVRNLSGSIFAWANEGRPLVQAGRPATRVHPYSPRWARLLSESRRAPLPDAGPRQQ